jgi:peptide-methionine (R)-S-oxide reductase
MQPVTDKKPDGSNYPVVKSAEQWRSELSDFEFHVLRESGTEPAWSGQLPEDEKYTYSCRGCGDKLFSANEKFDSHCGWPSFFSPLAKEKIIEIEDRSLGTIRTEVRCANCGSHLGHVFAGEGYSTPTDLRYCINAVCLTVDGAS